MEHEIAYLALRHTLLGGRVLRSGDPAGLEQEMWALLALYQALRIAITDAVATVPGTDPDRASYQIAVQTAQILVTGARNVATGVTDLAAGIGRAVLANLHGPRGPASAPARSIPDQPLEQAPARQTPHLPAGDQPDHRHQPVPGRKKTRRRRSLTPAPDLKSPALTLTCALSRKPIGTYQVGRGGLDRVSNYGQHMLEYGVSYETRQRRWYGITNQAIHPFQA